MKHNPNAVSWLHRFAAAVTLVAFASIVVGTFNSSSFAMLSRGHALSAAPYQTGHRVLALATAMGAIVLAAWLWQGQAQGYVRVLGAITAAAAVLCAASPGSNSLVRQTPVAAFAQAGLAGVVFSLLLCLALFTRTDWRWDETRVADVAAPSLRNLLAVTTAIVFVESILGAVLSAGIIGTPSHMWTSLVATGSALWVLEIALNKFSQVPAVKIPSILLAEAVVLQLFVSLVVHSMELNARASLQPQPGLAVINATHAAAAALALAAGLFATFQAFRYLAPAASLEATIPAGAREAKAPSPATTDDPYRIESKRPLNLESGD